MKVLVVHNRYRSSLPSGENMVVDEDVSALRAAGVDVETYFRDSDEIADFKPVQRAALAVRPVYSGQDVRRIRAVLEAFNPDVVHLHNPYPLISPTVIRVAKAAGVPVVQTVHNYRFACVNGLYFRDGEICQDCLGKRVPWPAVQHSCYRGSGPESAVMAAGLTIHRRTWRMVDRFLPVSGFVADQLAAAGVPRDRITVKPNSVPDPGAPAAAGTGFLFAGRLDEEKGILLLIDAWRASGAGADTTLTIVGDGVKRAAVEQAAQRDPSIRYPGAVSGEEVGRLLDASAVRIVPSLWFEGFPLAVLESFARARPVISTGVGANAGVVTDEVGWTAPTDAAGLGATIRGALADPAGAAARGHAARSVYERLYRPGPVVQTLIGIYQDLGPVDRRVAAGPA